MSEHTIPGGPSKGTVLSEADDKSIKYWLDRREKEVAGDPNGRFAGDNQAWIEAAKAELQRRAGGGEQRQTARAPSAPTTALQKAKPAEIQLGSSMNDPTAVTAKLAELAASYHLVSPASSVDGMPPGCGVQLSFVSVNVDDKIGEVYAVGGGKLGLSAVTLSKIGAAAGVSWLPEKCGRLDDGSHPHYVHYRAVGKTRNFDGSDRVLTGEVEIDARDGSPQIDEIQQKAAAREADQTYQGKRDGGASQILELRKFLLRHAERKAKSRAIADLGVKRSYTKAELAKPFAVANLMFTGQTDDPELKRAFAHKIADSFLGASAALYGGAALPQPRRELAARSAPPPFVVDGEGFEPIDERESGAEAAV